MRSRFHSAARADLADATAYYKQQSPDVSDRFLTEISAAIHSIEQHPEACQLIEGGVRRKVLTGFPYALLYLVHRSGLRIVAVAHQSRRPGYWLDRIPRQRDAF